MDCLVFTTVHNEARSIATVLDDILDTRECSERDWDVLVVDDGSTDESARIAAQYPVTVLELETNRGPGVATKCGYQYAIAHGYDCTVRMDADGQHPATYIPTLLDELETANADIVIGSRYVDGTGYPGGAVRTAGIRFYSGLISVLGAERQYDITSGYRAVTRPVARAYARSYPGNYVAIERGLRDGLSEFDISEVPVEMRDRKHGESFLTTKRLLYYHVDAVQTIVSVLTEKGGWDRDAARNSKSARTDAVEPVNAGRRR